MLLYKQDFRGFCVHRGPQRLLALWLFLLSPSEILVHRKGGKQNDTRNCEMVQ